MMMITMTKDSEQAEEGERDVDEEIVIDLLGEDPMRCLI